MNDKFKLELILPRQKGVRKTPKTFVPHLGLATVAALTPRDVEISLTDERISEVDLQKNVDMVGISAVTITASRAYEIADSFRERGVKVVLGGMHPSFLPEEAGQHADAVVIGEAEGIWPLLIEDGKAGRLKKVYSQEERPNPNCWPLPQRDLFVKSGYLIPGMVSTSRGCPFSCSFCSASSFFGRTYRTRPLDAIVDEFEQLKKDRYLFFGDDNIVGNPESAKELFRALIPYKKKWGAQASVGVGKDEELIELAARSGCVVMFVGFESVSQESLKSINKRVNKVEEYEEVVMRLHSHGIGVHGYFLFGFDEDDEGVFQRTVDFCHKLKLDSASFGVVVPLPGTPLYESLDNSGRIVTKDWTLYDRAVFEPKQMTREALDNGTAGAWREFYSLRNIWSRLGAKPTASRLFFWFVNLYLHYRYLPQRSNRLRATSTAI
jgi:radical SAM superfamily enzyme YgiQ (UPF0313 family)